MWTIRQEQIDAFRQAALQQFEDEMVEHLKEFAPRHWKVMGEQDGRKAIRLGIERAEKYGFTNRGPVRFYIELMFMFGSDFDTDPQYPWAREVLKSPTEMDQMLRADQLYERMEEYSSKVSGPNRRYLGEAMERLSHATPGDFIRPDMSLQQSILQGLKSIYPKKCDYLGDKVLDALVSHAFKIGQHYNFTTEKGQMLMVALVFAAGHGFPNDPMYSWIARRMDSKRWPDPTRRADELHSKAILYLKYILQQSGANQ